MTDFQRFMAQAWNDHADDAAVVAARLDDRALSLASAPPHGLELARLGHHVFGEHLARWADGIAWQQRVAALRLTDAADAAAAAAVADGADAAGRATAERFIASLSLAGQTADLRPAMSPSDATWATALAAASLAPHDAARAGQLLHDAVARFEAARLPDSAPCVRALAVSGNNLAAGLEERATRNGAERDLMLLAAQTARRFWALAGGWMEIERAEYRLAQTWLKAADAQQARSHAEACLALVSANGDVALERFFGLEVQVLAARALGETTGAATSLERMRQAFSQLAPDDQGWCRATLDKLAA